MSAAINAGDVWTLIPANGLGTGIGAIPAGAHVTITGLLAPFTPGVGQASEDTVTARYDFEDQTVDANGVVISTPNSRTLAYGETTFRALFAPPGGSG